MFFFSDEKNFNQDKKLNQRNDRWLRVNPSDVPHVMCTKFTISVIVLKRVNNEGHIVPPTSFNRIYG